MGNPNHFGTIVMSYLFKKTLQKLLPPIGMQAKFKHAYLTIWNRRVKCKVKDVVFSQGINSKIEQTVFTIKHQQRGGSIAK